MRFKRDEEKEVEAREAGKFTEPKERIRPCTGPCGRMTRPQSMTMAEAPGTVVRKAVDKCSVCLKAEPEEVAKRDAAAAARVESAHRANAAFLAQRQARLGRRTPLQRRMELVSHRMKVHG